MHGIVDNMIKIWYASILSKNIIYVVVYIQIQTGVLQDTHTHTHAWVHLEHLNKIDEQ